VISTSTSRQQIDFGKINAEYWLEITKKIALALAGLVASVTPMKFTRAGTVISNTAAEYAVKYGQYGYDAYSAYKDQAYQADLSGVSIQRKTPDVIATGIAGGVFDITARGTIRTCWDGPCLQDGLNFDGSDGLRDASE
jgi:hypothetical protein